jgi:DNA-binding transcriptional ArsR family regulator
MNIWQDGGMEDAATPAPADGQSAPVVRSISDVETLKAIADTTRLKLLSALMAPKAGELPVMSVKELAARLGEPQTKLYRHMKQLESAGLVQAVSSRVISGLVEQRYQACQRDLMLGPDLTASERSSESLEAAVSAGFDLYRERLFAAQRAGSIGAGASPEPVPHRKVTLGISEARIPVTQAARISEQLQAILRELEGSDDDENDGAELVTVNVLVGYFSPDDAEAKGR